MKAHGYSRHDLTTPKLQPGVPVDSTNVYRGTFGSESVVLVQHVVAGAQFPAFVYTTEDALMLIDMLTDAIGDNV